MFSFCNQSVVLYFLDKSYHFLQQMFAFFGTFQQSFDSFLGTFCFTFLSLLMFLRNKLSLPQTLQPPTSQKIATPPSTCQKNTVEKWCYWGRAIIFYHKNLVYALLETIPTIYRYIAPFSATSNYCGFLVLWYAYSVYLFDKYGV